MVMKRDLSILAGDCGATKTQLAIFELTENSVHELFSQTYTSRNFSSLEEIVCSFIGSIGKQPDFGCIGVPGPVKNGLCIATNLPWTVSEDSLSAFTDAGRFTLSNDLETIAYAVAQAEIQDIVTIYKGNPDFNNHGHKVVIAPGTGLGQSLIISAGEDNIIVPTEGGHADFAPQSKVQAGIAEYLSLKYGHVSVERVISGLGITNIFDYFISVRGRSECSFSDEEYSLEDKAEIVSKRASEGCDLCKEVMRIFSSVLGAHCGNVALTTNSSGGVILAGGIPRKNIELIQGKDFLEGYLGKGRLRTYLESIPVQLLTGVDSGIKGAALLAVRRFGLFRAGYAD